MIMSFRKMVSTMRLHKNNADMLQPSGGPARGRMKATSNGVTMHVKNSATITWAGRDYMIEGNVYFCVYEVVDRKNLRSWTEKT